MKQAILETIQATVALVIFGSLWALFVAFLSAEFIPSRDTLLPSCVPFKVVGRTAIYQRPRIERAP